MRWLLLLAALIGAVPFTFGQGISINATGAGPDDSAILDLLSTDKGLLIPRMTNAERLAIVLPATGLLVYQVNAPKGLYCNTGTPATPVWELSVTVAGQNWLEDPVNHRLYPAHLDDRVGIGTASPLALLHVADSLVVFTGVITEPPATIPIAGNGSRLMWCPDRGAFRVGYVYGDAWNQANIGKYSFAAGHSPKASGLYSVGLGYAALASGEKSFSVQNSIASGTLSIAIGNSAEATNTNSVALGYNATSTGFNAVAIGNLSTASGPSAFAVSGGVASGQYAVGFSQSDASGDHAAAFGLMANAQAYVSAAFGRFNVGGGNATTWVTTDPLFEIGNGVSVSDTKNALTVLKNGRVGIGLSSPNTLLHVLGDARFESNTGGSKIIVDGSTGLAQVEFQDDGAYGAGIGYSIDNSRIFLYHGGNVFVKSGNLGVGVEPTNKIDVLGGAYCSGTTWVNASDEQLKENFAAVDGKALLDRIGQLDVSTWTYRDEPPGVRHIGPKAQDFYALFQVGYDAESIPTVDADGVALAAIKALREENEALRDMIDALLVRVEKLESESQARKE